MIRRVITTDGGVEPREVGDDFESWNRAIGARIGTIVYLSDGKELWVDDEGLVFSKPTNLLASAMAHQMLVGDAILFNKGDIK